MRQDKMRTEFAQVPTSKALDERSKAVLRNSTRMNVPTGTSQSGVRGPGKVVLTATLTVLISIG